MIPAIVIAFVLLSAWLGGSFYAYKRTFGGTAKMRDADPESFIREERGSEAYEKHKARMALVLSAPLERVTVRSFDGLTLSARYYKGEEGAPVVLFFHGYRSNAVHDGCGLFRIARERGYHVFLCDQRAHGESEGRCLAFGVLERKDVLSWAEYAQRRFPGAKIFLSGISMGGATVLMAASLPLPKAVVGILADCPYSSPKEIIMKVMGEMGLKPKLVYPLVRSGARLFGGFDPSGADALTAVSNKTLPTLIVHGSADGFVPAEMSVRIDAASAGAHKLVLVEGADHGKSFDVAPDLYFGEISAFFDACLQGTL